MRFGGAKGGGEEMERSIVIVGLHSSECKQPIDVVISLQAEDGRHDPVILCMKGTVALTISDALRVRCGELGFLDPSQSP